MTRLRRACAFLAAIALAGFPSCTTVDDMIPTTGTLRLQLRHGGLVPRSVDPSGFQVIVWSIDSATADIQGFGCYDFLHGSPCGGTGLVLADNVSTTATVHLTFSRIEVRRFVEPDLPPEDDHDGDGLINRSDNCPLISNPGQQDANGDGVGDACSVEDTTTHIPTYPDADGDGALDAFDNCPLVANPPSQPGAAQADSYRGADLIGDACERFTDVDLPDGSVELALPADPQRPITFTLKDRVITFLVVDFRDAILCDVSFTSCSIRPSRVTLSVSPA